MAAHRPAELPAALWAVLARLLPQPVLQQVLRREELRQPVVLSWALMLRGIWAWLPLLVALASQHSRPLQRPRLLIAMDTLRTSLCYVRCVNLQRMVDP